METTTKLFWHGRSQAVRIPEVYRFDGVNEVIVRKEGDTLVLVPARKTWESYAEEAPAVGDDFLSERTELTSCTTLVRQSISPSPPVRAPGGNM